MSLESFRESTDTHSAALKPALSFVHRLTGQIGKGIATMITLTFIRSPEAVTRRGDSRSAMYRDIDAGLWTPAVKIGAVSAAWPKHEIDAILGAKLYGATPEELRKLVASLMAKRKELIPESMRADVAVSA